MKSLRDILNNVTVEFISGSVDVPVHSLTFDSRRISKGTVFFAIKGEKTDGHRYVQEAADAGASAIVVSEDICLDGTTCIRVNDTAETMGQIAANYYESPSKRLKLIGITGTNGKTTIATLLYNLFNRLGHKTGLISTVVNYIGDKKIQAHYTTPDVLTFNRLLQQMADAGCEYCFVEVSSHALEQRRTAGLQFAGAVFTNLTHDHLDYHKSFKNYIYAKKKLFDGLSSDAFALVNKDDKNAKVLLQNCRAEQHEYSVKKPSEYQVQIIESSFDGMQLIIEEKELWTLLSGEFNAYNVAAVFATARLLGARTNDTLSILSALTPVRGRMETINLAERTAVIDYAHTPDALKNVLTTIKAVKMKAQTLITVVGAGGNRDRDKRPIMAKIAQAYSDTLILTSDNPRDEEPVAIIQEMEAGLNKEEHTKVLSITDRRQAIKTAVILSQKGDIILIAGKGHETYQEIKGIRSRFDDKEVVSEFLMNIKQSV